MSQLLLPLLLMLVVAIPLVLGTRKQKRAAQEQQKLLSDLVPGDRVMTTSGLYGTVTDTSSEATIDVEIAPGVVTTWLRAAVREKVMPEVEDLDSAPDDASELDLDGQHEAITQLDESVVESDKDAKSEVTEKAASEQSSNK
jgi:preprotein translocase subunit YajC